MKEVFILKYSEKNSLEEVNKLFNELKNIFPNDSIIALPKHTDLLFHCSLEQLYEVKNIIDNAIKEMEKNG